MPEHSLIDVSSRFAAPFFFVALFLDYLIIHLVWIRLFHLLVVFDAFIQLIPGFIALRHRHCSMSVASWNLVGFHVMHHWTFWLVFVIVFAGFFKCSSVPMRVLLHNFGIVLVTWCSAYVVVASYFWRMFAAYAPLCSEHPLFLSHEFDGGTLALFF